MLTAYLPIGAAVGVVLLAEILFGLGVWGGTSGTMQALSKSGIHMAAVDNTRAIGRVLYTQYFYLFQVAGIVLLVAMIGAIVLTLRSRPGVRRQRISDPVAFFPIQIHIQQGAVERLRCDQSKRLIRSGRGGDDIAPKLGQHVLNHQKHQHFILNHEEAMDLANFIHVC